MDTKQKEQFLNNHIVISLPDNHEDSTGPATLFGIPRDAIQAWIKMTPFLSQAMEELKLATTKAYLSENPEDAAKILKGNIKDIDVTKVTETALRPEFANTYSTIVVAAILDMKKTWGEDDFRRDYAITDPEQANELVGNQEWRSFRNDRGWADKGDDSVTVKADGSVRMHLTDEK